METISPELLLKDTTNSLEGINNSFLIHNNSEFGGSDDDEDKLWRDVLRNQLLFIFSGVVLLLVCFIGCVVNVLSITVLLQKRMRIISISILLAGLQISDFVVVFSLMFYSGIPYTITGINSEYHSLTYLDDWVQIIARSISLWGFDCSINFTVVITIERYIAVCHPLRASSFSTRHAQVLCISVAIFSALTDIPYYFYTRVEYNLEKEEYGVVVTEFANSPFFKHYLFYHQLFFAFIIPFTSLIVLNIAILRRIRVARSVRASMQQSQGSTSPSDNSLTFISFSIVITFLICNSLNLFVSISWAFDFFMDSWAYFIDTFAILLTAINSSVNFFFYCTFGKKFRRELVDTFKNVFICKKMFTSVPPTERSSRSQQVSVILESPTGSIETLETNI